MKRQNVRTLALIVCTFTYLLVGATVFDALESAMEETERHRLREQEKVWQERYNITPEDFEKITQLGIQLKPYRAGPQWKFAGAFYFATTVITTIGYGHSTPKTTGGKIFCMVYALPGIPLCIVMFQCIGERINTLITGLLRRLKGLLRCKNRAVSQTHLIFVSANVGTIVLTAGAAVFSQYERWHYLDALYYCFITLTTIGFGDFVALQREDSLAKRPDYVAFSLIFILFGLTVVSSVMNLLVLRLLTRNTDDERRDELQAAAHAQELRRLHGDVIHSVIGVTSQLMKNVQDDRIPADTSASNSLKPYTNREPGLTFHETSVKNLLQNGEMPSSTMMAHMGKYWRSFVRLCSNESVPPDTPNCVLPQITEDKVTATVSYSDSELCDEEYSPWITISGEAASTENQEEQSQIFRFNDSCFRLLPKSYQKSPIADERCQGGSNTLVVQPVNASSTLLAQEHSIEDPADSSADCIPVQTCRDECSSPPHKYFRYS